VTIGEPVDVYDPQTASIKNNLDDSKSNIFPNPANDVVPIQITGLLKMDLDASMHNL
jgi:hypothetical protein